jgi:hypothetical protein
MVSSFFSRIWSNKIKSVFAFGCNFFEKSYPIFIINFWLLLFSVDRWRGTFASVWDILKIKSSLVTRDNKPQTFISYLMIEIIWCFAGRSTRSSRMCSLMLHNFLQQKMIFHSNFSYSFPAECGVFLAAWKSDSMKILKKNIYRAFHFKSITFGNYDHLGSHTFAYTK